jgi:hypothetical protein
MTRQQLRAIASFQKPDIPIPKPLNPVVTPNEVTRDRFRGEYRLNKSDGVIPTKLIGRSNSLNTNSTVVLLNSGNSLWCNN